MKYWKMVWAVLLVLLVACNSTVGTTQDSAEEDALKAGDIDPNFGLGGKSSTAFDNQVPEGVERSQVEILRVSGNRRIVSLGSNLRDGWALITRHTQGGSLDTGFGQGGKLRVAANLKPVGLEFYCPGIEQSSDCESPSRMVVAGTQPVAGTPTGSLDRIWLGAFSEKGAAETGFGQNGIVTATVLDMAQAKQLAVQADGKILLLANASRLNYEAQVVLRFLSDGKPDEAFGVKGALTVSDSNTDQVVRHMVLLKDGLLLLGPSRSNAGWLYSIRYKADGSLDTTYGGGSGTVSVFVGPTISDLRDTVAIADNLLYWGSGGMMLLGVKGELQDSFGDKGLVRFAGSAQVFQVVALPSGYIYTLAAPPNHSTATEIEVQRYYADGVLDDGFGQGGSKRLTLIGDGRLGVFFEPVTAALARYGNRVVVGGRTVDYSSSDQRRIFTLTRIR